MSISAKDVKALRDQTGAGMMDCKKALTEANGDIQKAIEILRKKGQKLSVKRADRDAAEGVVIAKVNGDKTRGVVVRSWSVRSGPNCGVAVTTAVLSIDPLSTSFCVTT